VTAPSASGTGEQGGRASIRAIGTAVPPLAVCQEQVEALLVAAYGAGSPAARRMRALLRHSAIETRHTCIGSRERPLLPVARHVYEPGAPAATTAERMALYREHAPPLALRACEDLLVRPGACAAAQVDHLFVASCTGFLAPGLDVLLARRLGLRHDVARTLVGFQGCQAGMSALRLADQACRADPGRHALVVCVELSTLHFQFEPTDDNLMAAALFADGAAAVLVAGAAVPLTAPALEVAQARTFLHPDSLDEMTWDVGDHGFDIHLGGLIPRILGLDMRPLVERELGLDTPAARAATAWAVHPGGVAILDALERSLELGPQALAASRDVLRRFGNMSSPTIHFVLQRLLEPDADFRSGVALAFGPGLSIEAARLDGIAP
jgi:predicted naringenin-chalcone synthase